MIALKTLKNGSENDFTDTDTCICTLTADDAKRLLLKVPGVHSNEQPTFTPTVQRQRYHDFSNPSSGVIHRVTVHRLLTYIRWSLFNSCVDREHIKPCDPPSLRHNEGERKQATCEHILLTLGCWWQVAINDGLIAWSCPTAV